MDTTENCWSFFINKACAWSLHCSSSGLLCSMTSRGHEGRHALAPANITCGGCLFGKSCKLSVVQLSCTVLLGFTQSKALTKVLAKCRYGKICTSSCASVRSATSSASGPASSRHWSTACSTTGANDCFERCLSLAFSFPYTIFMMCNGTQVPPLAGRGAGLSGFPLLGRPAGGRGASAGSHRQPHGIRAPDGHHRVQAVSPSVVSWCNRAICTERSSSGFPAARCTPPASCIASTAYCHRLTTSM